MKPRDVKVTWLDARGWAFDTLSLEAVPKRVGMRKRESIGWLVYEGPDLTHPTFEIIVLATDHDPPEQEDEHEEWGDFTVIPKGWVLAVVERRKPRAPKVEKGEP